MNKPHRKYEMSVHVSGDSWQELLREFMDLAHHIEEHGEQCSSVAGGPTSGHWIDIRVDPLMTHERWEKDLDAWMEKNSAQKREVHKEAVP